DGEIRGGDAGREILVVLDERDWQGRGLTVEVLPLGLRHQGAGDDEAVDVPWEELDSSKIRVDQRGSVPTPTNMYNDEPLCLQAKGPPDLVSGPTWTVTPKIAGEARLACDRCGKGVLAHTVEDRSITIDQHGIVELLQGAVDALRPPVVDDGPGF